MLKVENVEVLGWEHAIRGMRNPKNSWAKSDSGPKCPYEKEKCCGECQQNFCIGPNDKQLMMALRNAGTDHRKFMRMITVYLDITAPLYWWKEIRSVRSPTPALRCTKSQQRSLHWMTSVTSIWLMTSMSVLKSEEPITEIRGPWKSLA